MQQQLDDRLYYQARIERERALASSARHPEAARAHSILAELYHDRLGIAVEPAVVEGVQA